MTDVTLALGGGGSKGYAHLGVIKALQEAGFRIKAVAGTSAGGMAAAVFAAGYSPDEVIDRIADIPQDNLYGFGRGPALLSNKGIQEILSDFLGGLDFKDLTIPCALTTADLTEMREIALQSGKVLDAVMATTAVPGIFPPWMDAGRQLVDGMVLDPVPVRLARSLAPRLPVVAVTLSPAPERWREMTPWSSTLANPLLRPIARLRIAKAFDVYTRAMDLTLHMLGELRLELDHPDVLLRPEVSGIGSLDRVDIRDVAALGEKAVREAAAELGRIRRKKGWFR